MKGKCAKWLEPEGLKEVEALAATHTDGEMSKALGCAPSTYFKWLKTYPQMAEAVERGRTGAQAEKAVQAVEASLFERCIGGVHNVAKAMKIRTVEYDEATGRRVRETERIELATEQVYVPADVGAIKFFLTNRAPEKWKNRTELSADPETQESVETFLERIGGGREF